MAEITIQHQHDERRTQTIKIASGTVRIKREWIHDIDMDSEELAIVIM